MFHQSIEKTETRKLVNESKKAFLECAIHLDYLEKKQKSACHRFTIFGSSLACEQRTKDYRDKNNDCRRLERKYQDLLDNFKHC